MSKESKQLPSHEQCWQFLVEKMQPGMKVLDIGCGAGELMTVLAQQGCSMTGVEIDTDLVQTCREKGLEVRLGTAESLPFDDSSFDAIVCSVVLPYTDEKQAVNEWTRVLKPNGIINATYHGIGYGLNYALQGDNWKFRLYGLRMLFNTTYYQLIGRKLPGFLGDTLCQTPSRMHAYYRSVGLKLEHEKIVDKTLGQPRFLCHRLIKQS